MIEIIKNIAESICLKLQNLSKAKNRPFDEILRYYAIERFLYRLSISPYATRFFLKGGLMLKVWDAENHRATMDIDLLAKTSNKIEDLQKIIKEITLIRAEEDGIVFNIQKLTLRSIQTGGDYKGIRASFSADLGKNKIHILIDLGFNDFIIPEPHNIYYPTLLPLPQPKLMGYTPETVIAEKLESIVKLGTINTRMKDFYDIWSIIKQQKLNPETLEQAIKKVFVHRETQIAYPISFTKAFYESPTIIKRWNNFLSTMRIDNIALQDIIIEISTFLGPLFAKKIAGTVPNESQSLGEILGRKKLRGQHLFDAVEASIKTGADVNDESNNGHRPLNIAANNGFREIALLLLDNGADFQKQDRSGLSAFQWALQRELYDVAYEMYRRGHPYTPRHPNLHLKVSSQNLHEFDMSYFT